MSVVYLPEGGWLTCVCFSFRSSGLLGERCVACCIVSELLGGGGSRLSAFLPVDELCAVNGKWEWGIKIVSRNTAGLWWKIFNICDRRALGFPERRDGAHTSLWRFFIEVAFLKIFPVFSTDTKIGKKKIAQILFYKFLANEIYLLHLLGQKRQIFKKGIFWCL